MSKPGKHAKKYDQYRSSGRREKNKQLKAARNEKRIAKFKKRREEGKAYKYNPERAKKKLLDAGYKPNSEYYKDNELAIRKEVYGGDHKTETAKTASAMRKLNNLLAAKKAEEKVKDAHRKNNTASGD